MSLPLDAESLRCFVIAAETLNFRHAAKRVALSPPAFSDRIRRLEEELGVDLFVRSTRSVRISEAGSRLLPVARRALQTLVECRDVVYADRPAPFDLVVGTRFELGLSWLLPALEALEKDHPHRAVHLRFGDSPELLRQAKTGHIDAVVSSVRLSSTAFSYALLHEEAYVFVGSKSLLKTSPITGPDDVKEHTLIDALPDLPLFRYFLDAAPAAETWRFGKHRYLGTIAAIKSRVLMKKGVAVLPHYLVEKDLGKTLVEVLPDRPLEKDHFRLIWRRGHEREEALVELAEHLRAHPLK